MTAVAQGNLKRKLTVDAKGEIAALGRHDQLHDRHAVDLRRPGHQHGPRGRHRGQARRPGEGAGAAGLWRDLTDNVNQLAANLTNQVRSIAEVATAVTKGDLTRSIAVEASGEMAALKDTINEMITQPERADAEECGTGLAKNQSRPLWRMLRASAT